MVAYGRPTRSNVNHSIAALALLAAAACTPMTPAASSSSVLPPERSYVIVAKPAQPAALDAVRMFQGRGYALVDMTSDPTGVTLRFKGERKVVAEQIVTGLDVAVAVADIVVAIDDAKKGKRHHHHHELDPAIATYEIGSVFYVRIEPRGATMTSISAVGRPTRSGVEACTADHIDAPCEKLETGPDVHVEVAGFAEAETIHGVFSEMRVAGSVVGPDIEVEHARRQAAMTTQRCYERRREVEAAAARVSNPRAKAGILRTAPTCGTVAAAVN